MTNKSKKYRPSASSSSVSAQMRRVKTSGTKPELLVRQGLHRAGFRYRVQYKVNDAPRRTIDIAFPSIKLAVFVDGCFWHGCAEHRTIPKANHNWWAEKIEANKNRDTDTNERLRGAGWLVLRFWEHDSVDIIIQEISKVVNKLRSIN
ncbi:Very short patch repair protein [compost metagenome]